LIRQCKFEGIYFVFFRPQKDKETPTHIAHIGKAPRAKAESQTLPKSAILPMLTVQLDNYILFYEINLYFS
jgi:hypothetical protein